jgi:NDP-4-keto-2,6-dideoxyhexose 3-C-methyltransferase
MKPFQPKARSLERELWSPHRKFALTGLGQLAGALEQAGKIYHEIRTCRICKGPNFVTVISLGEQALTGRFPAPDEPDPPMAPLDLIRCADCGLVQLRHSTDTGELYDHSYGYRSGTNATMTNHLTRISAEIASVVRLRAGDVVLDIGCNDGTLLKSYPVDELTCMGIDPIADTFRSQYPKHFLTHAGFFDFGSFQGLSPYKKARAITSIAMFYDLEDPGKFVGDIVRSLAPDGVWVLEQSYLPSMLEQNSYDTICHEHLEYYALPQIERLVADKALRVFDVKLNDVNGGSFQVWVCHKDAAYPSNESVLNGLRKQEADLDLSSDAPYAAFCKRIGEINNQLVTFIKKEVASGKQVYVYGASTKGNVILQYLGLDHTLLAGCADRSPQKWGRRTPRTAIPIMSEKDARLKADYFLVLPWHFRDEFVLREAEFLARGGKLIFPLPKFELVGSQK